MSVILASSIVDGPMSVILVSSIADGRVETVDFLSRGKISNDPFNL